MPPDVLIRRCTLVVRRRGGWSWGPDPRRYLEVAMPGLERAITEALAEAGLPPDADGHLDEPVRLRLGPDGRPDPSSRAALVRALRAHGAEPRTSPADAAPPVPAAPVPPLSATSQTTQIAAGPRAWSGPAGPGGPAAAALAGTLGRWSRTGRLAVIVRSWPAAVTAAWLAAFSAAADGPAGAQAAAIGEAAVAQIAATVLPAPDALPGAARALVLLGAVVAATGDRPPPKETLRAVQRAADPGGLTPASPATVAPSGPPPSAGPAAAAAAIGPAYAMPVPGIVPALPFLVLVQLYRIGYLDGLTAAAAAAGLPDGAAALAAAVAGKCLPPPGPDGNRTPAEAAAVLAVAGLPAGRLAAASGDLHRGEDRVLEPLRAALTGCYAEAPAAREPLAASRGPDGVVCGERAGALPIAWALTEADLAPVLAQLGAPQVRFADTFAAFAAEFSRRRAFPGLLHGDLERHLGAAAGTALGSLATELWPRLAREAEAPLLALDRLGDLEASIDIAADGVSVGIPRGRRWMDLGSHGLLDAWPVPWAPGGRWELVTC